MSTCEFTKEIIGSEKIRESDETHQVAKYLICAEKNIIIRQFAGSKQTGLFHQAREYNTKGVLITPHNVDYKYVDYVDEASGESTHHDIAHECYFCGYYVLGGVAGMYNHMYYLCEQYPFKCARCSAGLFGVYDYKCKICDHQNDKMSIELDAGKNIFPKHCDFMIFLAYEDMHEKKHYG